MMARPKRGERKALRMISLLDAARVTVEPFMVPGEGWGLKFPDRQNHTPEQRELAVDALLFGVGYPRCFATMCRLLRERGDVANV